MVGGHTWPGSGGKGLGLCHLVPVEVGERALVGKCGVVIRVLEEWASAVVEVCCKRGVGRN